MNIFPAKIKRGMISDELLIIEKQLFGIMTKMKMQNNIEQFSPTQASGEIVVWPALDVLREGLATETLDFLRHRKIGLLTNHTGRARDGRSTLDVLRELELKVVALFSPEHGFSGTHEGHIAASQYKNLPVHSLYGETRRPTPEMLSGVEVLVCDLQDVGARFYTYASTIAHCLEECAKFNIAVVVFDRPNPVGGEIIEGPLIDEGARSFIGYMDIPVRHGMTLGELAILFQSDSANDVELRVARVFGWQRAMQWPQTGLQWLAPSPNLPNYRSAAWYAGTCLLEFSKLSVGRGTRAPFQIIGAPWLDAAGVLRALYEEPIFAENFVAEVVEFTPTRGEYSDVVCRGLEFSARDGQIPGAVIPLGLCLLSTLHRVQPEEFDAAKLQLSLPLLGANGVLQLLQNGETAAALQIAQRDAEVFRARRKKFLLYP